MPKIELGALNVFVLTVGPLETNCYLVQDKSSPAAMVIDPGEDVRLIIDTLRAEKLELKYMVLTHGHFDHTGAVAELKNLFHVPVYMSHRDGQFFPEPVEYLDNIPALTLGDLSFEIIPTPGHTPGSLCLLDGGVLFSGDTLFAGGYGRTDLPGGNEKEMKASLKNLLESLPPETVVFPGHGPATTISVEKQRLRFYLK